MSDDDEGPRLPGVAEVLTRLERGKGRITRYDARAVLLALGEALDGEPGPEARGVVERLGRQTEHEAWAAAVREELLLAGAEFTQAVDPRFLDHPRYDFDYTVASRERLERRLVAAEAIGLPADEALLDRVARADALLAPHLRGREGRPGLN